MERDHILEIYKISFINEISHDGTNSNFFHGGREMEMYFTFLKNSKTIEADFIPVVDHYINGNPFSIDNDITVGGGYLVEVTLSGVHFINPETHQIDQVIPLEHFKRIAQLWAEYNRINP